MRKSYTIEKTSAKEFMLPICVDKENQLDATEWFIALIICSTCFGHFYAHHQELETICVLLLPMVCSAWLLIVGVRSRSAGCASGMGDVESCNIPLPGHSACCPAPDLQQPATKASHTIGGNNTHIVSSP